MSKHTFRDLCLAASLALAAVPAWAAPAKTHDERVERLTDAMVELLPFGTIFDGIAAAEPAWPVQDNLDDVSASQLVCLRGELSSAGYRRYARGVVKTYADAQRDRLDADIALLENGVAELFGKLVLAGAEGERTGVEPDPEQIMGSATPEQQEAFMTFFSDPAYAGLRQVAGIGDQLDAQKSAEENEAVGERMGADLAVTLMRRAIDTCGVEIP